MKVKQLTTAALLTALAIIIPFIIFFKIVIPPFSATLGAHVPMFVAMLLGPKVAIMVGLGSAFGFFLNLGPLVGARAFMHVFVGLIGSSLINKGVTYRKVSIITAPIHGLLEAMVIMPFIGFDVYNLLIVTFVGTILHHFADAFIAHVLVTVLEKAKITKFA